ncbi:vesicle transport v-SNARE 11 [Trypanosoma rangeli]|uniref:Vesicle transport v-SNARE 11 n=1 Tax=Trypanosoma rangeli TaxID=5698 RepID=A0A422NJV1_TRYRA|nr:vesicle transport v-SNARE 11 [Trypanosoma rangeli]RNF05609.1 vesicle transport v-SNARE 11 [Trypanosoma rangeli]|eukprot:RNF05609.1 vesicle transport v-SNARE 11 [Trypanosoma rangeli]
MASGLFASYEEDFNENLQQVREAVAALQEALKQDSNSYEPPPATGPRSRAHQCQVMQQGLVNMRELVTSMLYESNDVEAGEARNETRRRVEDYKKMVTVLEEELCRLRRESQDADRMDLITGGNDTLDDATREVRVRALDNTEKLRQGTTALERAERTLHEAGDLGTSTFSTLRTQTETMRNFHSTIYNVDAELLESRRIVNQMQRTATKKRLCLMGIIAALTCCLVGMIFIR